MEKGKFYLHLITARKKEFMLMENYGVAIPMRKRLSNVFMEISSN